MEKGTGCVKITPAHDFSDNEVGKRHNLPMINIFTLDAHVRAEAEVVDTNGNPSTAYDAAALPTEFAGMERFAARKAIVDVKLARARPLAEISDHVLQQPYGDRGGVAHRAHADRPVVRARGPMAKTAIEAVEDGRIQFVPKQYENMYFSWMRDIRDWCVSRQLWWGHASRPGSDDAGNVYVGRNEE